MKFQKIFSLCLLIMIGSAGYAQKWKPWVVADGGVMWGAYEGTGDYRIQGGLKKSGWLVGVGAAYDPYRFHSIPVYVQGRKLFGNGRSKPFVLASFGASFTTEQDQPKNTVRLEPIWSSRMWLPPSYQYGNGTYAEGGIGWAFRTTKKWGFNLSLSYTRKTLTQTYSAWVYTGTPESEATDFENKYLLNRMVFRIGAAL